MVDELTPFRQLAKSRKVKNNQDEDLEVDWQTILSAGPTTPENLGDRLQDDCDYALQQPPQIEQPLDLELDDLALGLKQRDADLVCEYVRRGLPLPSAFRLLGLNFQQVNQKLNDIADEPPKGLRAAAERQVLLRLKKQLAEAIASLEDKMVGAVMNSIEEANDVENAKWVLERRFPKNWGKQTAVKHSGKTENTLNVNTQSTVVLKPSDLGQADLIALEQLMLRSQSAVNANRSSASQRVLDIEKEQE